MPIQLTDLDMGWKESGLFCLNPELEYLAGPPLQAPSDAGSDDIWSKFDLLDNVFGGSSSALASPLWDEAEFRPDWEDIDIADIVIGQDVKLCQGLRHDCMWSGACLSSETGHCDRTSTAGSSSSNCCTGTMNKSPPCSPVKFAACSSTPTKCGENISNISAGSSVNTVINSSCSSVSKQATINNGCNVNTLSTNNSSSSSCNSTAVVHSGSSSSSISSSNNNINSSSSYVSVQRTAQQSGVVQTIQVPSAGGAPRRTGVIVQKTVGRSLLIRSRTKPEATAGTPQPAPPSSVTTTPSLPVATASTTLIARTVPRAPPTPVVAGLSRPETPQSLSEESEEDVCCPLDPSVFSNLDNLRPPTGDMWDDVLAAVQAEAEAGLEPLTPSPSKASSVALSFSCSGDSSSDESSIGCTSPDDRLDRLLGSSPIKVEIKTEIKAEPLPTTAAAAPSTTTVVADHCYGKNSWLKLEDLGVQTPSDSEEEIDVVSFFERTSSGRSRSSSISSCASSPDSSSVCSLPTEPSVEDREELQELTASKLLSASRAVSQRLRAKAPAGRKGRPAKRRLSGDDYDEPITRLPKKQRSHIKHHKSVRSRFATEFEIDSKEKRHQHNNMERMRRIDLRNSFEDLRCLVPSLVNKERAPKVLILQDAAIYCTDLKIESRQLQSQSQALKKEQDRLRAMVSALRRSLAASR